MSKLRKSAQGQECLVRIPGVCSGGVGTTVLAHLGGAGMGRKHPDLLGAFCCYQCHQAIDGHHKTHYTRDELKLMHLEGMVRTQLFWIREGFINV